MSKRADRYIAMLNKADEIYQKDYSTGEYCHEQSFKWGFQEGCELAEKDLGWISVKDRLPEKDGWYFTCVEMSGVPQCVGLSHFETYSGQWDDDDDSIELVDYWMPIPALPKEDEK
jgi:hypothetical protein